MVTLARIDNESAYNCIHISVATIAKYYGRDYQMISGGNWALQYEANKERIGQCMDVVNEVDVCKRVERFHGFSWIMLPFDRQNIDLNTGSFHDFNYPFLGNFDLYYSPWSEVYQKHHFFHCLIILGYDVQTDQYTCLDPYLKYKVFSTSSQDLFSGMNRCGKVVLTNPIQNLSSYDYWQYIQDDMQLVNCNKTNFLNIHKLADDIENRMDIHCEFDEFKSDLHAVPILDRIRKISLSRHAYAWMLDYVYKVTGSNGLDRASNLLLDGVTLWKIIQARLTKQYLSGMDDKFSEISSMVRLIAGIEQEVIEILCKLEV